MSRRVVLLAVVAACLGAPGGAAAQTPSAPANDNFANSHPLNGSPASHTVSTAGATTEPSEPDTESAGGVTANTVWYHWLAPASGMLRVDAGCNLSTSVYTGSAFANLVGVGPVATDVCARKYPVTSGMTYRLQIGHNAMFGAPGTLNLSVSFANEFQLRLSKASDGTGSVTSQPAGIDCGFRCQNGLHVFAGGTEVTLTATSASTSTFTGWSGGGCTGTAPCTVTMDQTRSVAATFTRVTGPANDNFASAENVGNGVRQGSTIDATLEPPNEPDESGLINRTVWYRYVPASSGILRVTTCQADFSASASVFTGLTLASLERKNASVVYGCPTGVGYAVAADTPYYIQVAGTFGEFGTFQLGLQLVNSFPVHLTKTGTGSGSVTSSPAGINCGFTCSAENAVFPAAQMVTLSATPASPSSTFDGWTGACAGAAGTTCQLTMDNTKTVGATFTRAMDPPGDDFVDRLPLVTGTEVSTSNVDATMEAGEPGQNDTSTGATLWYQWTPAVRGTVTISTCGSAISAVANVFTGSSVASLTPVITTETACAGGGNGSLKSWRVSPGQGPFHIQLGGHFGAVGNLKLLATFVGDRELTVTKTGTGTVTSAPAGISCGAGCLSASELFAANSTVTLTAAPEPSTRFVGWGGACTGSGLTCEVTMNAAREVTAAFAIKTYELQVTKSGTGAGIVTSNTPGIDCGADCAQTYDHGTDVVLTAAPAAGSTFGGWGGACSGSGPTCSLSMVDARSVSATFVLNTYPLTVQAAGNGRGTISSVPAGIDCGVDCTETYGHGTAVALTATPAPGSTFAGWSGAGCSGTGPCAVSMTEARTVLATFTAVPIIDPPPPVKCKVPGLKGKTLAQAKTALTKANCKLGKVSRAFSPRAKKGKVLKQSPAAGRVLPKGSKVALTLGKGPRR